MDFNIAYYTLILSFWTFFLQSSISSKYYDDTNVEDLNGDDFFEKVRTSGVSVVEFYKDSCKRCKDFSKVYKNFANVFDGILPVIAVNDEELFTKYGVKSFPSVKVFLGKGPNSDPDVVNFEGERDLDPLVSFTMKNLNKYVKEKASKLTPKSQDTPRKVFQLTSSNFKSTVLDDTFGQWLVKFYAPWCGHCKNLEPDWMKMPKLSKGVKVGRVDCTVHSSLCAEFNVKGYPTILLFNKGEKSLKNALNYQGSRRAEDILEFAKKHDRKFSPPVHAKTVSVLVEKCSGPLCLLLFLPEASKAENLKTAHSLFNRPSMPFELTYTLVGEHEQWEKVFNLSRFPSVVGLNMAKGVFLPLSQEFSQENLDAFVTSILSGKASGQKLSEDLVDSAKGEL